MSSWPSGSWSLVLSSEPRAAWGGGGTDEDRIIDTRVAGLGFTFHPAYGWGARMLSRLCSPWVVPDGNAQLGAQCRLMAYCLKSSVKWGRGYVLEVPYPRKRLWAGIISLRLLLLCEGATASSSPQFLASAPHPTPLMVSCTGHCIKVAFTLQGGRMCGEGETTASCPWQTVC